MDKLHVVPVYEIFVDGSLAFTVRVFMWLVPDDPDLYVTHKRSMRNVTLSNLISVLENYNICTGITNKSVTRTGCFIKHCIPRRFELYPETDLVTEQTSMPEMELETEETDMPEKPLSQTEYSRCSSCEILTECGQCTSCEDAEKEEKKNLKRKSNSELTPAKLHAPISLTSPERIKLALQEYRLENKQLKTELECMKQEIQKSSVPVSSELSRDLIDIMSNASIKNIPPFMKLFWEEQQKYLLSSKKGIRYHPMIIRYCLGLAAKSPTTYDEVRFDEKKQTGFVILPSRRRLRDYKNYIRPKQGFNKDIIIELRDKVKDFSDSERFVIILFDEMKIQQNLVWDKHSGELIGFVDLGDIELNYSTLEKVDQVATHVLVFLVRSIVNPFKFSMANFSTTCATSFQIFPLFWKAVSICELQCMLKVVAATSDGASTNRKMYRMHSRLARIEDVNDNVDVTYRTLNLFSNEKRYIYFFSDPPHLLKTARNCLANSGAGRCTRYMWNNGMFLIWEHIYQIYKEDVDCGLHLLPKLTYEHVKLTPYSVMNVKLAAQVLSSSVSAVLEQFGDPGAAGTAKFCRIMDQFFDCMNVRNKEEHVTKGKPFLKPFDSADDERFTWMVDTFLKYFHDWQASIEARPGNFTKNAKSNMFISWQTFEGIKITVHSAIDLIKFLLSNGVKYVLTERFCQDALENYFGRQRAIGHRKDNPTLRDFGYNDNTIRNQRMVRPIMGNCAGGNSDPPDEMDSDYLPSRKIRR